MEDPPDKIPVRRLLSSIERHIRRGPRDAADGSPGAEKEAPAPLPEEAAAQPAVADASGSPMETKPRKEAPEEKGIGVPVLKKPALQEKIPSLPSPSTPPGEIPRWSGKRFGLTPEQAKRELDPRNQMSWLMDKARNRPFLSMAVLAMVLVIIVMDLLVIFKKLNVSRWLAVSVNLDNPTIEGFWTWEKRTSALAYLSGNGKVVQDATTKSAVSGEEKLPKEKWAKPAAKGGLAGIIAPDDMRGPRSGIVSGIDPYVAGDGGGAGGRMMILQAEGDSISSPRTGKKAPTGVFLGEAGELLSNFAPVTNPVKASSGFLKTTSVGYSEKAPQGVHGEDLVEALSSEDLANDLVNYQKNGQWILNKTPEGSKPPGDYPLAGFTMKGNQAVIQLVETKASTDLSLDCGACILDTRIHNSRATFYGEKHQ